MKTGARSTLEQSRLPAVPGAGHPGSAKALSLHERQRRSSSVAILVLYFARRLLVQGTAAAGLLIKSKTSCASTVFSSCFEVLYWRQSSRAATM